MKTVGKYVFNDFDFDKEWRAKEDITLKVKTITPEVIYNAIKKINIESLSWDDKTWEENLRGTTLKRIKPWMWRRNIRANLGNQYIDI